MKFAVALLLGVVQAGEFSVKPITKNHIGNDIGPDYKKEAFGESICLNLNTEHVTISGFSSGAYQTGNLLSMFNEELDGGALIGGGGPCATRGWCFGLPEKEYPTEGLEGMPVYFWSGELDELVPVNETQSAVDWFKKQGANVKMVVEKMNHFQPNALPESVWNPKANCQTEVGYPNCGYDAAGDWLRFLYKDDLKQWDTDFDKYGQLYVVDQTPYWVGDSRMADHSFLYVPDACQKEQCRTHIWFHGCGSSSVDWGTVVMRQTGLLEYAATNNIIMYFPQVDDVSTAEYTSFPHCWVSSTQSDHDHPQLQSVRRFTNELFGRDVFTGERRPQSMPCGGMEKMDHDGGEWEAHEYTKGAMNGQTLLLSIFAMMLSFYSI